MSNPNENILCDSNKLFSKFPPRINASDKFTTIRLTACRIYMCKYEPPYIFSWKSIENLWYIQSADFVQWMHLFNQQITVYISVLLPFPIRCYNIHASNVKKMYGIKSKENCKQITLKISNKLNLPESRLPHILYHVFFVFFWQVDKSLVFLLCALKLSTSVIYWRKLGRWSAYAVISLK